jgi:hypothetical protein
MDAVMVYAKLYPRKMIEKYRKAMRGVYSGFHGEESSKKPTRQEWDAFAAIIAAACAIWELIFAHFRQASTAHEDSFAWDAAMHKQERVLSSSFRRMLNGSFNPSLACEYQHARRRQLGSGQNAFKCCRIQPIRDPTLSSSERT